MYFVYNNYHTHRVYKLSMFKLYNLSNIFPWHVLLNSVLILVAPVVIIITQYIPSQWSPVLSSTNTLTITTFGILLPTGFGIYYTNITRLSELVKKLSRIIYRMIHTTKRNGKPVMFATANSELSDDESAKKVISSVYTATRNSIHLNYFNNKYTNIFSETKHCDEFIDELSRLDGFNNIHEIILASTKKDIEAVLTEIYNIHPGVVFETIKFILITLLYIVYATSVTVDIHVTEDNFVYYWISIEYITVLIMLCSIRALEIVATLFASPIFVY